MAQTVLIIRHAQAMHNVDAQYKNTLDPVLTDTGKEQCIKLREHLKERLKDTKVDRIIVSPMQRALQTAMISLDWLIEEKGVPVEASALWQEIYDKPCDTGQPVSVLQPQFPLVDFSKLDPVWPDKTSPRALKYATAKYSVLDRGAEAIMELGKTGDKFIIVVSHSGFLRKGVVGRWFANGDYRLFHCEPSTSKRGNYKLIEQPGMETGGMGRSKPDKVFMSLGY